MYVAGLLQVKSYFYLCFLLYILLNITSAET